MPLRPPPLLRLSRWFLVLALMAAAGGAPAQELAPPTPGDSTEGPAQETPVQVEGVVADEAIAARLTRILEATGWYREPSARVDEGVVFLTGATEQEKRRAWAANLAQRTEGVVAVVNRIELIERSMWDLSEAGETIQDIVRESVRRLPLIAFGLLMLVLSVVIGLSVGRGTDALFRTRLRNTLLRSVTTKLVTLVIFILGLYLVLRVAGLTRLAATLLGGTGIIGLVIGFAFRDIAENFLASVLMSLQRPFAKGDMIKVAGYQGLVQQLNSRSTLLMTLEGNHVQIPNATIYKETIVNFTANPLVRIDFVVGIGYDCAVARAQQVGLDVLRQHEAILHEPEPLVLVESLAAATVDLRFFCWIDSQRHAPHKVKSALQRLAKRAFQNAGVSMPDAQREIVFPEGVPVSLPGASAAGPAEGGASDPVRERSPSPEEAADDSAPAAPSEGKLESDAGTINAQAHRSRRPEGGTDLLEDD